MDIINLNTLAIISVLTTLSTESTKKILDSLKIEYASNIIALICSIVISAVMCLIYPVIIEGAVFSPALVLEAVIMAFMGVLSATLTYDKVVQALKQIKG